MTVGQTVLGTVSGAVTVVGGGGATTAARSVSRARQPANILVGPGTSW